MQTRIFYWVGLTVTQPFNTGVQRVTRCLATSLQKRGVEVIPVKWDGSAMAPISQVEADHLAKWGGPKLTPPKHLPEILDNEWLLLPEITYPVVPPGSNVARLGRSLGMQVAAIFYDLIPLKTPELYTPDTLERLNLYWQTFASVTVAISISQTVKRDLIDWLADSNLRIPFIEAALLAGEIPDLERTSKVAAFQTPFNLVAVGTWEPRKNYPRILRAIKTVRTTGADVRITIVGRKAQGQYPDLHAEMFALAKELGPSVVALHDYLSDADMAHLFETAQATIFGSWIEGFGLPVLESLWRGLPCICHNGSALAEIAPGGGTVMVDMRDEVAIAAGIRSLATDRPYFDLLAEEAVKRPITTWDDYSTKVLDVLERSKIMAPLLDHDPIGYSQLLS